MNTHVLFAIFKRNFVAYFTNPTGYVFVCVFVLLSSIAAFWPNDFFNANLANLDQLNKYLPFIMLIFIPAITMSIWAEERRLRTDELLLTIPAADLDVVLGKYLSAVAIFTSALLYSAFCNVSVLFALGGSFGATDLGLFAGMYLGYWLVGVAMLAIGMVASFLTANLTVGFVLGVLFNAPLVFLSYADAIPVVSQYAGATAQFSISGQFKDFGRGVIQLSSIFYFLMIVAVMLYLAMILIGRRHWRGRTDGRKLLTHYVVRAVALVGIACGTTVLLDWTAVRFDATEERLNTLLDDTRQIVQKIETEEPILVEAFISEEVPEAYVQQRRSILNVLQEFDVIGGGNVRLRIHDMNTSTVAEETRAEDQYGILPQTVIDEERGVQQQEQVFLGVAFRRGLNKVVIPFMYRGQSPEYELVRAMTVVSKDESTPKPKLGFVLTAAATNGDYLVQIEMELQKLYDVEGVDPSNEITGDYDVLLAVQPSSLLPHELKNLISAVRRGIPTAIFEDPFPMFDDWTRIRSTQTGEEARAVVGTAEFKAGYLIRTRERVEPQFLGPEQTEQLVNQDREQAAAMNRPPQFSPIQYMAFYGDYDRLVADGSEDQATIADLWNLLGVEFPADRIVAHSYNPMPEHANVTFVDKSMPADFTMHPENPITAGLNRLIFVAPGFLDYRTNENVNFMRLASTTTDTSIEKFRDPTPNENLGVRTTPDTAYTLAALITGNAPAFTSSEADGATDGKPIKVVLVADIDCLGPFVIRQREMGAAGIDLDNVSFLLNTLDVLTDSTELIRIRTHGRKYYTLGALEWEIAQARGHFNDVIQAHRDESQAKLEALNTEFRQTLMQLDGELNAGRIGATEHRQTSQAAVAAYAAKSQEFRDKNDRELQNTQRRIKRDLDRVIQSQQNYYKMLAVTVPPVLPLLVGVVVFFKRRGREKQGVAATRLR